MVSDLIGRGSEGGGGGLEDKGWSALFLEGTCSVDELVEVVVATSLVGSLVTGSWTQDPGRDEACLASRLSSLDPSDTLVVVA